MSLLESASVTAQRARRDLRGELMRSLGLVMRQTRLSVAARDRSRRQVGRAEGEDFAVDADEVERTIDLLPA